MGPALQGARRVPGDRRPVGGQRPDRRAVDRHDTAEPGARGGRLTRCGCGGTPGTGTPCRSTSGGAMRTEGVLPRSCRRSGRDSPGAAGRRMGRDGARSVPVRPGAGSGPGRRPGGRRRSRAHPAPGCRGGGSGPQGTSPGMSRNSTRSARRLPEGKPPPMTLTSSPWKRSAEPSASTVILPSAPVRAGPWQKDGAAVQAHRGFRWFSLSSGSLRGIPRPAGSRRRTHARWGHRPRHAAHPPADGRPWRRGGPAGQPLPNGQPASRWPRWDTAWDSGPAFHQRP